MYRLAVEFPLFYGNKREDVREFLNNYSRAGILNGWDEGKLALGLPLFLKKHASSWFKTLSGSENFTFEVLSRKLISHFESSVTLWQVRQKLAERRQLLEETVADYYYDILSFCSSLNLPKSEWLYCFVRGLRPKIRGHVILQQPTDVDSALNFARLKELVTLGKSKNVQEGEECSKFKSNPLKEDIKQIVRDELNVWTETSQNNEKHRRVNRKFRSCNFPVHCGGTVFSKKPKLGRYRNFKPNLKPLHWRNNTQNVFNQGKIGAQLNWLAPLSCVVVNP